MALCSTHLLPSQGNPAPLVPQEPNVTQTCKIKLSFKKNPTTSTKGKQTKKKHPQETTCSLFSYKKNLEGTAIVPFSCNLLVKMLVKNGEDAGFNSFPF